jgi:hypothetical protein
MRRFMAFTLWLANWAFLKTALFCELLVGPSWKASPARFFATGNYSLSRRNSSDSSVSILDAGRINTSGRAHTSRHPRVTEQQPR